MAYISPSVGVYILKNSNQLINTGTITTVTAFDTLVWNTGSLFTVNLSTGTVTIPSNGYYYVMTFLGYQVGVTAGSDRSNLITQNLSLVQETGVPQVIVPGNDTRVVNTGIFQFSSGDAINVRAFQQDANNLNVDLARIQVWKMS